MPGTECAARAGGAARRSHRASARRRNVESCRRLRERASGSGRAPAAGAFASGPQAARRGAPEGVRNARRPAPAPASCKPATGPSRLNRDPTSHPVRTGPAPNASGPPVRGQEGADPPGRASVGGLGPGEASAAGEARLDACGGDAGLHNEPYTTFIPGRSGEWPPAALRELEPSNASLPLRNPLSIPACSPHRRPRSLRWAIAGRLGLQRFKWPSIRHADCAGTPPVTGWDPKAGTAR